MKEKIITKLRKGKEDFYFSPRPYYIKNDRLVSYKENSNESTSSNNNFEEQNILGLPSVSYYENNEEIKIYENRIPASFNKTESEFSINSSLKTNDKNVFNNNIKYISKTCKGENRFFEDKSTQNLNLNFLDDDILIFTDNEGNIIRSDNFINLFNLKEDNENVLIINSMTKLDEETFIDNYDENNSFDIKEKEYKTFFDETRLVQIQNNQIKGVYSKNYPYCLFKHSGSFFKKTNKDVKYNLRYQISSSYIFNKIIFLFTSENKRKKIVKFNTNYINEQIIFDDEYDNFEIYAEISKKDGEIPLNSFENFIINNISLEEVIPSISLSIDVNSFDYYSIDEKNENEIIGYLNTELEKESLYIGKNLDNMNLIKIKSKREGKFKGKENFSQTKIIDCYSE